ncbi:phosphotyrosine protein phosphatases I [Aaosphaeria arxii CBS 175.79]|uniref:Phosphotyrosine protein phosphatases I n=1 Tax=Aaosphaeria arxii CBS 175.79 TaxID=1450172 RepID=A0A6A5Y8W4_9PLEO|nr:phosphotyrosine protein phosphatases I [Aaosphaeria arxii CBS 175.79]KAF2021663.1 phosphotyrosine protein phosphatases I [Aaosphaeria arxii CBS 175.79]
MAIDQSTIQPVSVLFVCLGNICRSTMAEGVFRSLTQHPSHPLVSHVDSSGTGAYHAGDDPDYRTMETLEKHGITDYTHRARKFRRGDFKNFDYILAMDKTNLRNLLSMRNEEVRISGGEAGLGKVMLFGEFGGKGKEKGTTKGEVIDDPYYGDDNTGFEVAYEQCTRFSRAFLKELEAGNL